MMANATASPPAPPSFRRLVNEELADGLQEMGIFAPNAIQADAVPLALSGRDLMVVAQTGSGKTLMFLLPMLQRLSDPDGPGPGSGPCEAAPEALVLAPTDELATQVAMVAEPLAAALREPLGVGCLADAKSPAERGCGTRLLISTPERVLGLTRKGVISLERVRMLAIDEADAILCSRNHVKSCADELLSALEGRGEPPQLFLTMAHLTQVREDELVQRFPSVQRVGHTGVLVPTLRQCFHYFRSDKEMKLLDVLGSAEEDPWLRAGTALVFCSSGDTAECLRALLEEKSPSCKPCALHEKMQAEERAAVFRAFQSAESRVLFATDAAARGLDFPHLRHVIMYDVPSDITAFVHCAGRTARRGQRGLVTCLVQTHEASLYQFDFKSHHGLQPAAQLSFPSGTAPGRSKATNGAERDVDGKEDQASRSAPAHPDEERGRKPKVNGKDQASRSAPAHPDEEWGRKPKVDGKERRLDPLDGRRYTFQEMQRYYRRQYGEAEILRYWTHECTPIPAKWCPLR